MLKGGAAMSISTVAVELPPPDLTELDLLVDLDPGMLVWAP
jgi:hypothetical protein